MSHIIKLTDWRHNCQDGRFKGAVIEDNGWFRCLECHHSTHGPLVSGVDDFEMIEKDGKPVQ